MLNLAREAGEKIVITCPGGEKIVIEVGHIGTRQQQRERVQKPRLQCVLRIDAPLNCAVHREELYERIRREGVRKVRTPGAGPGGGA